MLGTESVLGAALDAEIPRAVYITTSAPSANRRQGRRRDLEHPGVEFTSYYEKIKYEAHQVAKR